MVNTNGPAGNLGTCGCLHNRAFDPNIPEEKRYIGSLRWATPIVVAFGVFYALYGVFVALGQTNLKRPWPTRASTIWATSWWAWRQRQRRTGARSLVLDGAVLWMVSHRVVTCVLFLLVGMLQDRAYSRQMG